MGEQRTFDLNGMQITGPFNQDDKAILVNGNELIIGPFADEALEYNTTGNTDESGSSIIDIRDRLRCAKSGDTHSEGFKENLKSIILGDIDKLPTKHSWEGVIFLPEVP